MAGGRKSKYHEYVEPRLDEIFEWKKKGIKESKIAEMLGVANSTFEVYKSQFPELMETIKKGNIKIAEIAEDSLIQGIQGHFVEETETIVEGENKKAKKQRVKKTKRWIPANPTLIIFALKNRDPAHWNDNTNVTVTQKTSEAAEAIAKHIKDRKKGSVKNDG